MAQQPQQQYILADLPDHEKQIFESQPEYTAYEDITKADKNAAQSSSDSNQNQAAEGNPQQSQYNYETKANHIGERFKSKTE